MADPETDPLIESVVDMIETDEDRLRSGSIYLLLAALEGQAEFEEMLAAAPPTQSSPRTRESGPSAAQEPNGVWLRSITVSGFRGIGPRSTLELQPMPGLTIVSGRNGSGKSTFAEGLEVAMTSSSYRWRSRSAAWQKNWANLHEPHPCELRVETVTEGVGATTIGVDWPSATGRFQEMHSWVQQSGGRREQGLDSLGWDRGLSLYNPLLAYEELSAILNTGPSKLYDALEQILGLERVTAAQRRITEAWKQLRRPGESVQAERTTLRSLLKQSSDERASEAARLLARRAPDLEAIRAIATGRAARTEDVIPQLSRIAEIKLPESAVINEIAAEVESTAAAYTQSADDTIVSAAARLDLLRQAVALHDSTGDQPCPVCSGAQLNAGWRKAAVAQLEREEETQRTLGNTRRAMERARLRARQFINDLRSPPSPPLNLLGSWDRVERALAAWREAPDDSSLADHLRRHGPEVIAALTEAQMEAAAVVEQRQDAWAPYATALAQWVGRAEEAASQADRVAELKGAADWLRDHAELLRNERIRPVTEHARHIWAALRQESNVDIASITLPAPSGNNRQVAILAEVDGQEAGAFGVMSNGELHALALALFLPRAARPESPFRFIVLDDPVQAMDPSKVDGLVEVLAELAATRQVVVFSHDDRLPSATRRLAPNARIVEVTRDTRSRVGLREALNPARRDLEDANALVLDKKVPDEVLLRVLPRLCRSAFESAARDAFYARALGAGDARDDVERRWTTARTGPERIALALYADPTRRVAQWLRERSYRRGAMDVCGRDAHAGLSRDPREALDDVRRLVDDLLAART